CAPESSNRTFSRHRGGRRCSRCSSSLGYRCRGARAYCCTGPSLFSRMKRILLSVPHMSGEEEAWVHEAFASNWLSTKGPNLSTFERAIEQRIGVPAVALSSG